LLKSIELFLFVCSVQTAGNRVEEKKPPMDKKPEINSKTTVDTKAVDKKPKLDSDKLKESDKGTFYFFFK